MHYPYRALARMRGREGDAAAAALNRGKSLIEKS
jgi:hypothetical protein